MAKNIPFDIVGSFNEADAVEFDPQQLVNLYQDDDAQGRNGKALFTSPGLSLENGVKFSGGGAGRRLYIFKGELYAIVGLEILALNENLHYTKIGEIGTETGHVGIADNGSEILFVDGTGGWLWNPTSSSFTTVVAAGFPTEPTDVAVLGSRFVVSKADSNQLHFSEINDGSTWNALDEFALTAQPDIVVGLRRLNDRLFIMGQRVTEVWYDAGEPVLPYRRSDVISFGCAAVGSIDESFGVLAWLTRTDNGASSVVMATSVEPVNIATQQIRKEFQRYGDVSDTSAFLRGDERGHAFYQINFTNANKTWAFDFTEKKWLQLTYDSTARHRAADHAYFNDKHYVLDYALPYLYHYSTEYFTDDGVNIRRKRVSPLFSDPTDSRISLNSVLIYMKQGTGLDGTNDDTDPEIRMRISHDGGITYGDELSTPVGQIGRRETISQFFRLGQSRTFVFELTYDNATQFVLLGMTLNIDVQQEGY